MQIDQALKTHTKPLKVDVSLVLVPVTITDPMNRLVTGLDKRISAFSRKDKQRYGTSHEDGVVGVMLDVSAACEQD